MSCCWWKGDILQTDLRTSQNSFDSRVVRDAVLALRFKHGIEQLNKLIRQFGGIVFDAEGQAGKLGVEQCHDIVGWIRTPEREKPTEQRSKSEDVGSAVQVLDAKMLFRRHEQGSAGNHTHSGSKLPGGLAVVHDLCQTHVQQLDMSTR